MISGRVQGVFFRQSARDLAERHGLSGWIRNRADGRVEAVFEGAPPDVEHAVRWCRQGPSGAQVSGFEGQDELPTNEAGFRVLPTHDPGDE